MAGADREKTATTGRGVGLGGGAVGVWKSGLQGRRERGDGVEDGVEAVGDR
jgi:hypothetical protein